MDEVRERPLAVDLDDGNRLAVAALELAVAADVDLVELEAELVAHRVDDAASGVAEVAARGRIEDDASRYG